MAISLNISGAGYLMAAALLLTMPLRWLFSAIFAAIFHEFCHLIAIYLLKGNITGVSIGACGTVIECDPMSRKNMLPVALAGPAGSLGLVFFCRYIPRIALCAGMQGLFNLLPIHPLDGGRIVFCLLSFCMPEESAEKALRIIESVTVLAMITASVLIGCMMDIGILPLIFSVTVLCKGFLRKIPCKDSQIGVQ